MSLAAVVGLGGGGGGGGAVTVADGANVTQGAKADAPVTNPALSASEISLLKGLLTVLEATLTVGGSVTANAGTNLNTSALALETGGNLASLVTAEGAVGDAIVAAGAVGSLSAKLRRTTQGLEDLKSLIVLAAGTNVIGHVLVDSGTLTAISNALPAGTNILGKVTTDQTTHGLTDLVAADLTKVAGASVATGHGTAAGALRVELPTDGTGVVGLAAGSVVAATPTAGSIGGTTPFRTAALTNVAQAVKASAGSLYGLHVQNPNTSAVWVQLYDLAAASVVVGTTTPVLSYWVPASGAIDKDIPIGIAFLAAIAIAATTTATGGTAPASALVANSTFK